MIKRIEELGAEFEAPIFAQGEAFEQADIGGNDFGLSSLEAKGLV